jgi:signal transduction histidine kinase
MARIVEAATSSRRSPRRWLTAAPIIRRREAEERIAQTAIDLARRNQALEDFAGLVAHELKTPLHAALLADDPSPHLEHALDRVDAMLEAAQSESGERVSVTPAASFERAVADVGAALEVTTDLQSTVPPPPGALRVILRNLLANAVAAGAHKVHVSAVQSPHARRLSIEDDGVGLADGSDCAARSGLGLLLSRRIAVRFGGVLDLAPNPCGGTRAMLEFKDVPQ